VIPDLFTIGPFTLHSFGLMAALALIVAAVFLTRDLRDRGLDPALGWEIAVGAGIGGFIGARIEFLAQNDWEGGLVSSTGLVWYGGLVGGTIGVILVALIRRVPIGVVANAVAAPIAIGYAVGRIGCQLSGDGDYGTASSLPWAMSYPDGTVPTSQLVHPTPLYETVAMLLIFWYLWRSRERFNRPWELFGVFLILTGVERLLIEFIRRNDTTFAGLTTPQLFSLASIVVGALIVVTRERRAPSPATG
jgi:phosphatidylglycerol---prolipoprotein diacylglyceryl transferase